MPNQIVNGLIVGEIVFQFKQFTIHDDRSSLKVGTDGVLLGVWAGEMERFSESKAFSILDIGCGSGLISLMMAQRFTEAYVLGVDIDEGSVQQARENVAESPFAERVEIIQCDAREMKDRKFQVIVCNPPFYTEDTVSPDCIRANARNVKSLPFEDLVLCACRLLDKDGVFAVILPTPERNNFINICHLYGMHLSREKAVRTVQRKAPKRVLLEFNYYSERIQQEELILQQSDGKRTPQYQELCKDFYL